MIPEHFEMIRRRREHFWWYVARREIFSAILRKHIHGALPFGFDAGCGPGTNEALYPELARRWLCADVDRESFTCLSPRPDGLGLIADLASIPVADASLDLVLLLDVLEHLPEEGPVLLDTLRVLKPGGLLLVSVPAFQALWSWHDVQAGHFRRYRLAPLRRLLESLHFEVLHGQYYNSFLAVPILLIRSVTRRIRDMEDRLEVDLSPRALNGFLLAWLRLENSLSAKGFRMPWGTTAVILARAPFGDRRAAP